MIGASALATGIFFFTGTGMAALSVRLVVGRLTGELSAEKADAEKEEDEE